MEEILKSYQKYFSQFIKKNQQYNFAKNRKIKLVDIIPEDQKTFKEERAKFLNQLKQKKTSDNPSLYLKRLFKYEKILYTENKKFFLSLIDEQCIEKSQTIFFLPLFAEFDSWTYPPQILQQCYIILCTLLKENILNVHNVIKNLPKEYKRPSSFKNDYEEAFFECFEMIMDSMKELFGEGNNDNHENNNQNESNWKKINRCVIKKILDKDPKTAFLYYYVLSSNNLNDLEQNIILEDVLKKIKENNELTESAFLAFSILVPQFHKKIETEVEKETIVKFVQRFTNDNQVEINLASIELIRFLTEQEIKFDDKFKLEMMKKFIKSIQSTNKDDLFVINCHFDEFCDVFDLFSKIIYELFGTIENKSEIEKQIENLFIIDNLKSKDFIVFQKLFYSSIKLFDNKHVFYYELFFRTLFKILEHISKILEHKSNPNDIETNNHGKLIKIIWGISLLFKQQPISFLKYLNNNKKNFLSLLFDSFFFLLKNYDKNKPNIKYASKTLCSGIDVIFPYVRDSDSEKEIIKRMKELLTFLITNNLMNDFKHETLTTSYLILETENENYDIIFNNLEKIDDLLNENIYQEQFLRNRYVNFVYEFMKRTEAEKKFETIKDNIKEKIKKKLQKQVDFFDDVKTKYVSTDESGKKPNEPPTNYYIAFCILYIRVIYCLGIFLNHDKNNKELQSQIKKYKKTNQKLLKDHIINKIKDILKHEKINEEKETLRQCLVVIDKFLNNITDINKFIENKLFNFIIEDLSRTIDKKIDYLIFIWVRFIKLIDKSYKNNEEANFRFPKDAGPLFKHRHKIIFNLDKAIEYYNQESNINPKLVEKLVEKIESTKEKIWELEPSAIFVTVTSENVEITLKNDSDKNSCSDPFLKPDDSVLNKYTDVCPFFN